MHTLKELFEEYKNERQTVLDLSSFSSMSLMYPALLIAASDGNVSKEEKIGLSIR